MKVFARVRSLLLAIVAIWMPTGLAVAQVTSPDGGRSPDGLWQAMTDRDFPDARRRTDFDGPYAVLQLNRAALDAVLAGAPHEDAPNRADASNVVMTLPLPDGRYSRFRIEESPILAPELQATFPELKTYRGVGVDDATATARLDLTVHGFHAQIIAAGGTVYIDPYSADDQLIYISYDKASVRRTRDPFVDTVEGAAADALPRSYGELPISNGTIRRTYRLALAATAEYTTAAGGTVSAALSRMTTSMNRVNGIYERELAVRMTLATGTPSDPTALIFTNASTDGYTNDDGFEMLDENQTKIDAVVGSGNYDIGHVFSTGGGGIAYLGSVCSSTLKAGGVTGLPSPVGDVFDVDYVAHEMGHQFGGNHTFNGTSGSCGGGNRSSSHAFEVGSGSTIMAYAGICSPENTQRNSNDIFHFESLNEMTAFITSGGGSGCGSTASTGNTPPVATSPGSTFSIPRGTPFSLTASATDSNGDSLTYLWEEYDLGASSASGTTNVDSGNRPLFRTYQPSTSPTRTFPSLQYILNNNNIPPATYSCSGFTCVVGEVLPATTRNMNFHVTVRDNRAAGGAIHTAMTVVSVNAGIGPFAVTGPNTAVDWPGLSMQTVTWDVNSSNTLAANVAILMSTDGGNNFPYVLAASTPNDGSEAIVVPAVLSTTARIMVRAVGNIFFDISNANFTVSTAISPPGSFGKASPSNGAGGMSLTPTLSWTTSTGAASYEYCLDRSDNGTCNGAWSSVGASTSWTIPELLPNTQYSWQVRAVNSAGNVEADSSTWWTFTTQGYANPLADLLVDFGTSFGIWSYYDAGGGSAAWQPLHNLSPTVMATGDIDGGGRTDVVMSFPGLGVWAFMNNTTWAHLHPSVASSIAIGDVNGNGREDVVVTFAGLGVWIRYDSGAWLQLNATVPTALTVGNIDGNARAEVIASFAGQGTWVFRNDATWVQLHPLTATKLRVGDLDGSNIGDLIIQFPGLGQYIMYDSTTWRGLHPVMASDYITGNMDGDGGGRADLLINFPGLGVWAYKNDSTWTQIHGLNPSVMAMGDVDGNGQSDVIVNFPGFGIYIYRNQSTWTQIHNIQAEDVAGGRVNAN